MRLYVKAIGLIAPGLDGWQQARAVLAGHLPYQAQPLSSFKPALLPPNERRRTTALIKLALQVAEDALRSYPGKLDELASVFASAEGDADVTDRICRALLMPDKPVSPTHFHNSVHNAAAGYWAIASGSRRFSTSVAAGRESFVRGLMEAATVATEQRQDVMLLAYDQPLPPPLQGRGLVTEPFAMALIISPQHDAGAWVAVDVHLAGGTCAEPGLPAALQSLRAANPAAASLPLLQLLALGKGGVLSLPCSASTRLCFEVSPC